MDADFIEDAFEKDEVSGIYLNFSDPWPKNRYKDRRLTSGRFLARYNNILKKDAAVEFKTDNQDLFSFSVEEAKNSKWNVEYETRDLHNTPENEGNVMTEYEKKFSALGNPICKMIITRDF
jgi:tRNA (guanine-N7-)-methyltransferase